MREVPETKQFIYEFGKFVLDPQERVLFSDGQPIHLTDKVFDTLLLLITRQGRLVTKEEMMESIWDESFVEEGNVAKNISRLRRVLAGDDEALIETLPRRGYRFLGDVRQIDAETSLLIRRSLKVKITQTSENGHITSLGELKPVALIEARKSSGWEKRLALVCAAAFVIVAVSVALYIRQRSVVATLHPQVTKRAIQLTHDQGNDGYPRWTADGHIRFLRIGTDHVARSFVMDSDGANEVPSNDFPSLQQGDWSPNGEKVMFGKPGDKSSFYLANSDGSEETALPFYGGNADWSSDNSAIVYQNQTVRDKPDIFIYSLKTGKSINITKNPSFDADPSFSPDGKQVVFVSLRDGNAEIYLMNSDGTDVRRLTNDPAWDSHPVFSPDGTQISFDSDRDNESSDIYLMRNDGSDIRRLVGWRSNENAEGGCWSPDGTKIAFTSDINGNDDIYVMNADSYESRLVIADENADLRYPAVSPDGARIVYEAELSDQTGELRLFDRASNASSVIVRTDNFDTVPVWSPDQSWIAFQERDGSNSEVSIIHPDGTSLHNLTNNPARDGGPAFSPDGTQIIFASNRQGNTALFQLYTMNLDGSDQKLVFADNAMSGSPGWSPDGHDIVFASDSVDGRVGNFEIFKFTPGEPSSLRRLTYRSRVDGEPALSPDGKRVAFVSNQDGNPELYLMNSDGSGVLRLTRDPSDDRSPRWTPDGRKIIFASNRSGRSAIYEIDLE